jgi:poly(beta-D-mannuronate) lyase
MMRRGLRAVLHVSCNKDWQRSMKKGVMLVGAMGLLGGALYVNTVSAEPLKSPFDVTKARSVWQDSLKSDKSEFICPEVAEPVIVFGSDVSRYCQDDSTRSQICSENEAKYQQASEGIDAFNKSVVSLANRYVKAKKPRPEVAQCALSSMATWAKAGAWSPDKPQPAPIGEFKRGMSLAALASAYQLIQSEPTLDPKQKQSVEAWLKGLARPLMAYVAEGEKAQRPTTLANHRYWQGFAVAQVGIATQDRALFDWGVKAYTIGMAQVQENGVLPLELNRAKKGYEYHLFALQPLVMLERILNANGVDTQSPALSGKMGKLVGLIVPMMQDAATENAIFSYKDAYDALKDNQIAWLEVYAASHPDAVQNPTLAQQQAIIQERRSLKNKGLYSTMSGGDMSFFFGKP